MCGLFHLFDDSDLRENDDAKLAGACGDLLGDSDDNGMKRLQNTAEVRVDRGEVFRVGVY